MRIRPLACASLLLGCAALGCTGDVQTTDDSVRMEAEVPRVELGEGEIDLNPATDDDVDIDTPRPGDT